MKNQEEIKSIKLAQRELADRLEALETEEPKRLPLPGEVWGTGDSNYLIGAVSGDGVIAINTEGGNRHGDPREDPFSIYKGKRLGTFDEVYVLRSGVEKDYVSKEDLRPYSSNLPPSMKLAF